MPVTRPAFISLSVWRSAATRRLGSRHIGPRTAKRPGRRPTPDDDIPLVYQSASREASGEGSGFRMRVLSTVVAGNKLPG